MSEVCGYRVGEIDVKAAFTSEFVMDVDGPLQQMVNELELDRRNMDVQEGMYIKYVPSRFDPITRQLITGGAYLFDTAENNAAYEDWTANVYEGRSTGIKFWNRPIFKNVRCWSWEVVGAHNFTLPQTHALSRVQHWQYEVDSGTADKLLHESYPRLRDAARDQGATALWLLHQPGEKLVSLHFVAGKPVTSDHVAAAREAVARLELLPPLGTILPGQLRLRVTFDRTSLFMQQWLPVSRVAGGAPQATPNHPVLPQVAVD